MTEGCDTGPACRDWAGHWRSLAGLWGIPALLMLAALLFGPFLRTVVWSVALIWMGGACIANARRWGRTHCRFTGPFYLLMASVVVSNDTGLLNLGDEGWIIIGMATGVGTIVLWWGSERIWGRILDRMLTTPRPEDTKASWTTSRNAPI